MNDVRSDPPPAASQEAIRVLAEKTAALVIDAIPGALGMTPDPWPEHPDPRDGQPHKDVAAIIEAALAQSPASGDDQDKAHVLHPDDTVCSCGVVNCPAGTWQGGV